MSLIKRTLHLPNDVTIVSTSVPHEFLSLNTSALCSEWSTKRVLIEVFLAGVLIENIFSAFVIATTTERRGNPFIIRCTRIINVASLFLILQLLFYPFAFSWSNLENVHGELEHDHEHEGSQLDDPEEGGDHIEDRLRHPCRQADTAECKISGLLFGIFLFLPLLSVVLMTVDTALAAFRWKMYRFRPKAVTSLRIALFVGFTIIIAISFILPSFELGTHYHYHNLFKICWLSVHPEDYEEQGFSYFIFGFGCFLVFLVCFFGYLVWRAYTAELSPLKQMIGHQCTILFGRYVVMKSQSWVSYVRFVLWMDVIVTATYFPLTAGYIIKFRLSLSDTYWFNLVTEVCVLLLPTVGPIILVFFYESHRKRALEILGKCCHKSSTISHGHQRISPIPSDSSSSGCSLEGTFSESSFKHTVDDSPKMKLFSDSLKKQVQQEDRRRVSNPFTKHLKHPSPNVIHNHPQKLFPNIQVDLYGPSSLQEAYQLSSGHPGLKISYHQRKRKSLPGPGGLYIAALPLRRSFERNKGASTDAQHKKYHHLQLSPRIKRPSPSNSRERKAMRHSVQVIPDLFDSPITKQTLRNREGDFFHIEHDNRSSGSLFDQPPSYEAESSSYPASAFSHVDEQGYMWSSDYLRAEEGYRQGRRHSNASLLMRGFNSSASSQNR